MTWEPNNDFLRKFIQIYHSHPSLWKVRDKTYGNKQLQKRAYQELIEHYKAINQSATKDTIRKKINNLRTAFRREWNNVKKSKETATSPEDVYVPNLWYYDLLFFIVGQERKRRPRSTACSDEEEQPEIKEVTIDIKEPPMDSIPDVNKFYVHNDESNMSTSSISSKTPSELSIKAKRVNKKIKTENTPIKATYKNVSASDDEFDTIGKALAFKLRRMDENQRNIAEYLLNQILYYGVQNKLDEGTYICFGNVYQN